VNGAVNTGLAIANPNNEPAAISYYFTDASGVTFGAGTATIEANSQVAAFLNEAPFRPASSTESVAQARSFTFSSSLPVGVIALRGYTNERSEFLMTTLPVAGYRTEFLLLSRGGSANGTVDFNLTVR
jgi:hypothetical protein